jgi:thiol peroxidase
MLMARQITLKGKALDLEGPELKPGMRAPAATLKKSLVDSVQLGGEPGPVRLISVVPSLDTPVCALQTKRFNQEAAAHAGVQFCTVSVDLPPAQARFCGAEGIDTARLSVLSDHFDCAFGKSWGTLIPALRIEARALFIVDREGIIRYAEYVPEVTNHPNYDEALKVLKSLE